MARYIKSIDGRNEPVTISVNVDASQTIKEGDLIQIDATSRKGKVAVAESTTLIGIAQQDITTGVSVTDKDNIPVVLLDGAIVRIDYTGTVKTSLEEKDLYTTAFDLSDKKTIDLDDTTDGMCQVVAFNNENKTADVVFKRANLAIQ